MAFCAKNEREYSKYSINGRKSNLQKFKGANIAHNKNEVYNKGIFKRWRPEHARRKFMYIKGKPDINVVLIKNLKKGEYFTFKQIDEPKDRQVWVRDEYDISSKKFLV